MLCPFLLHMKMNQLYVSMCPLPSGLPFHSGPPQTIKSSSHLFSILCAYMHAQLPVQFFVTPWNAAHQAPLSMGFSRQEY